ncbi:hypothetical protein D3C87_1432480 [compost metagenome]
MRRNGAGRNQQARPRDLAGGDTVAQGDDGVAGTAEVGHGRKPGLQRDQGIGRALNRRISGGVGEAGDAIAFTLLVGDVNVTVDHARQDELVRQVHHVTFADKTIDDFTHAAILDHQGLALGHAARGGISQQAPGVNIGHGRCRSGLKGQNRTRSQKGRSKADDPGFLR